MPLDGELRHESKLFTGKKTNYYDYADSLLTNPLIYLCPSLIPLIKDYYDSLYDDETLEYMESHQSSKLNGNNDKVNSEFKTKYYAIGGLMINEIQFNLPPIDQVMVGLNPPVYQAYDFPMNTFKIDLGTFSPEEIKLEKDFYKLIASKSNLFGLVGYGKQLGDGVVETSSQFGLQIKKDKVIDFIKLEQSSLLVSTNYDYWINYNDPDYDILHNMFFHNAILRMELMHTSVLKYIND